VDESTHALGSKTMSLDPEKDWLLLWPKAHNELPRTIMCDSKEHEKKCKEADGVVLKQGPRRRNRKDSDAQYKEHHKREQAAHSSHA
jgi:hypothetical protein